MKKMLLSAVLMGMLALGITTSTEACTPRSPGIHTINRIHDHHFNKVQDKSPKRFVCGRDRRGRVINGSTCGRDRCGRINCNKKYDRSRFGCTRTTIPPQHTYNISH